MKTATHQEMQTSEPVILSRSQHSISRKEIDPDALKVLYRLYRNGFKSYLVGGAVRDLLLAKKPKDFDVVTDAHPGQVKKLFSNCLLIGRRFRLAHIRFKGGKIIEVATFRKEPEEEAEETVDLNNTFGTPREDAFRRDLTINGMFYDISDFSIIDYVGGLKDLENHLVRMIGNPHERYLEDPVRIWRVLRHAARLGFNIDGETAGAIYQDRDLICACSGARLFEEFNKDLDSGYLEPLFTHFKRYGILPCLFGTIGRVLEDDQGPWEALSNNLKIVDSYAASGKTLSQDIVLTLLFWPWAQREIQGDTQGGDIVSILHDGFQGAGMSVTIPKALKTSVIQTMVIVERMFTAVRTGKMRWSLKKRARYQDASIVFALLFKGEVLDAKDPFGRIFRDLHPTASGNWRKRGRPRRRYRKKKAGSASE